MQHDQPLAFLLIRHAGHDERLLGRAGQFVQLLLDLDVRHHLAADLAEAAQAVGDLQEAVFVNGRDVAGDIPAVAQHFGGLVRAAKVALHDVGAAHQQQAGLADRQSRAGVPPALGDCPRRARPRARSPQGQAGRLPYFLPRKSPGPRCAR